MLGITFCPKCQRPVAMPAHVHANALVQCPLCHAEYAMHEAIPPELLPIARPPAEPMDWPKELIGAAEAVDEARLEEQENDAAAVVERISIAMNHVPRHKKKPWWKAPLEVVFGAVFGTLIAYYGLAIWLGPELKNRGFPVFSYLPGVTWLTTLPEKPDQQPAKPAHALKPRTSK